MLSISFGDIARMPPEVVRGVLPGWLRANVDGEPQAVDEAVRAVFDPAPDAEIREMLEGLAELGLEYRLYPANPLARRLSRGVIPLLLEDPVVEGIEGLRAAIARGPVLLLSNHLSYVDTQVTDTLLYLRGATDIADAIVAVAGPKVYGTLFRRMASLGLGTLKTAQSSSLAHNEAGLSPREVGRVAVETVGRAHALMERGAPVLVYAEGARSRDGRLRPFLRAVTKYAARPGISVVPVAVSGTARVYPLDSPVMYRAPVRLVFGEPVPSDIGRREAVEACWRGVAAALAPEHRPEAGTPPLF